MWRTSQPLRDSCGGHESCGGQTMHGGQQKTIHARANTPTPSDFGRLADTSSDKASSLGSSAWRSCFPLGTPLHLTLLVEPSLLVGSALVGPFDAGRGPPLSGMQLPDIRGQGPCATREILRSTDALLHFRGKHMAMRATPSQGSTSCMHRRYPMKYVRHSKSEVTTNTRHARLFRHCIHIGCRVLEGTWLVRAGGLECVDDCSDECLITTTSNTLAIRGGQSHIVGDPASHLPAHPATAPEQAHQGADALTSSIGSHQQPTTVVQPRGPNTAA